jgi:hypothetical protein
LYHVSLWPWPGWVTCPKQLLLLERMLESYIMCIIYYEIDHKYTPGSYLSKVALVTFLKALFTSRGSYWQYAWEFSSGLDWMFFCRKMGMKRLAGCMLCDITGVPL